MTERLPMETRLNRNDWSWIGRAGCIFFCKSFGVRWVQVSIMGSSGLRLTPASSYEIIRQSSVSSPLNRAVSAVTSRTLSKPWGGRGFGW